MCQWAPLCARCCPLGACLPRLKGAPHGVSPAQGIEVGLVAKLTAYASAVTLGHYTQAVRGGDDAVEGCRQERQIEGAAVMTQAAATPRNQTRREDRGMCRI